jgi:hypothetical protein
MTIKKQQILGVLAAAVATVAFAAPAAHADDWYRSVETGVVRPDDRADRTIVLHRSGHAVVVESVRPDDRAVRVSPVSVETAVRPDDRAIRVSPGVVETAVRPDDRSSRVSPVSPSTELNPAALPCSPTCPDFDAVATPAAPVGLPDDRAGVRGAGAAPQTAPVHIVVASDGFDWTDAGIGAGLALGLILLGSGMLLVARRHRKPTVAAL